MKILEWKVNETLGQPLQQHTLKVNTIRGSSKTTILLMIYWTAFF